MTVESLTYVDDEGVRRLKAWDIVVPDDFDEDHARINYDFSATLEALKPLPPPSEKRTTGIRG